MFLLCFTAPVIALPQNSFVWVYNCNFPFVPSLKPHWHPYYSLNRPNTLLLRTLVFLLPLAWYLLLLKTTWLTALPPLIHYSNITLSERPSVINRISFPKDFHVLSPGNCECVKFYDKIELKLYVLLITNVVFLITNLYILRICVCVYIHIYI